MASLVEEATETMQVIPRLATARPVGQPTCERCTEAAETYCVECRQALCRFCVSLLHHPTTNTEMHSIEEIDLQRRGVQIVSPFLLDVLLGLTLSWLVQEGSPGVSPQYFEGESFCPAISRARGWLLRFDVSFFYYLKARFSLFCDVEDSFWRLLTDTWWRGVLTGTDSWLLLLSTIPTALLFHQAARVLLVPPISVAYALAAVLVRKLERSIPESFIGPSLASCERWLRCLSVASFVRPEGQPPPPTQPRGRPSSDILEFIYYHYDRQLRRFEYHRAHAQAVMSLLIRLLVWASVTMRLLCMVPGVGRVMRSLVGAAIGEPVLERHRHWLREAAGVEGRDTFYSDWLAALGLRSLLKRLPSVGGSTVQGVWESLVRLLLTRSFILLALLLAGAVALRLFINHQREEFKRAWMRPGGLRDATWGKCSRDIIVDWRNVRFDRALGAESGSSAVERRQAKAW